MNHFGEIFSILVKNSGLTKTRVAELLKISRGKLYPLFDNPMTDCKTLEKVCRLFQVSPMIFFDPDLMRYGMGSLSTSNTEYNNSSIFGNASMNVGIMNEVQYLRDIINEKERMINFLQSQLDKVGYPSIDGK